MAQTTDIVLNAAGYMLQPGTYKRLQDGHPEGATQRVAQTDFFGGQRRSIQLERDTFGKSLNVGPALGGQGIQPWAPSFSYDASAVLVAAAISADASIPYAIVRDRLYFALGTRLVRGPNVTPGNPFAWFEILKDFPNPIVDLTIYNSSGLLISFGAAADLIYRDVVSTAEVALMAGERGTCIASYAGWAAWSDQRSGAKPTNIRMNTGSDIEERLLDHDPIMMTTVAGELFVATKQSTYTYKGRVKLIETPNPLWNKDAPTAQPKTLNLHRWSGEFEPFYQQGAYIGQDDFRFVVGFGGRTIAWVAGGVHEHVPSGDRAGWRSTGLTGRRCFGGCVAAGYVIVSIESEDNRNELWAYDGNGWWRIASKAMPANKAGVWCNPMPIGAGINFSNVLVFRHGSATVDYIRLADAVNAAGVYHTAYAPTAEYISSMIDAGERDKTKAWRRIGCSFAAPMLTGNTTSTDALNVYIDYSTNAGSTWTQAATKAVTGNTIANNNFELSAAIPGTTSSFLMIRVRWASINDWSPTLAGIWAEYETLQTPARRRKWQFTIHARDQEVDRDGAVLTRTGRQLIAELWQAWQQDTPLAFRDQDYDDAPTQRTVRIVGISEAVANPSDANEWGDSYISLNLVEV